MKKLILSLLFLAVAFGASAKFRCGPVVGMDVSRWYWRQYLMPNRERVGVNGGLQCELMIPGIGFGVDFGLRYAYRGAEVDFSKQTVWESEGIGKTDLRLHTVQIPLSLRFKYTRMNGVENYVAPIAFAGPRFNFNVANTKCEAIDRTPFSVGIAVGLGAELYKRFQITAGYVWDVTDDAEIVKLDDFYGRIQGWTIDFCVLF